jgi:hypothetical protein
MHNFLMQPYLHKNSLMQPYLHKPQEEWEFSSNAPKPKKTVVLERGQKLLQALNDHAKKQKGSIDSIEPTLKKILAWTENSNKWRHLVS